MSEDTTYYLILDVTHGRLIGGDYIKEVAKQKAIKKCVNGEFYIIIETTNNKNHLQTWSSIYPVYHGE